MVINNAFNLADTDSTGRVSEEDVGNALIRAANMVDYFDINHDGVIERENIGIMYGFFHAADTDGDGVITLADVEKAVAYGQDLITFFNAGDTDRADKEDIVSNFMNLE